MLKYFLATAALVVAGVPAAMGLAGNASFTRDIPVRVPEQAQTTTPASAPTADDDGTNDQGRGEVEPGDDHGGAVPRDDRTEAGDDRGHDDRDDGVGHGVGDDHGDDGPGHDVGDDHGSTSGRDDSGSGSSSVDDRSGSNSGSDDSGSDSSGSGSSGGGGSDDGSGHD